MLVYLTLQNHYKKKSYSLTFTEKKYNIYVLNFKIDAILVRIFKEEI